MHITILHTDIETTETIMNHIVELGHDLSFAPNFKGAQLVLAAQKTDLVLIEAFFPELDKVLTLVHPKHTKTCLMTEDKRLIDVILTDYYLKTPFPLAELENIVTNSLK
jgi:DNA-binding response OmpR family regulator